MPVDNRASVRMKPATALLCFLCPLTAPGGSFRTTRPFPLGGPLAEARTASLINNDWSTPYHSHWSRRGLKLQGSKHFDALHVVILAAYPEAQVLMKGMDSTGASCGFCYAGPMSYLVKAVSASGVVAWLQRPRRRWRALRFDSRTSRKLPSPLRTPRARSRRCPMHSPSPESSSQSRSSTKTAASMLDSPFAFSRRSDRRISLVSAIRCISWQVRQQPHMRSLARRKIAGCFGAAIDGTWGIYLWHTIPAGGPPDTGHN